VPAGVEQPELEKPRLSARVHVCRVGPHEGGRHHVGVCVGSDALVTADKLRDDLGHGQPQPRQLLQGAPSLSTAQPAWAGPAQRLLDLAELRV
tara:strand:+ start:343 stop:621 length:279 start_codon:yes stop_codon:yes gene_type:complete